jgi:hypothetical protein
MAACLTLSQITSVDLVSPQEQGSSSNAQASMSTLHEPNLTG